MTLSHEDLKNDVTLYRQRVDASRETEEIWRKQHAKERKITVGSAALWTFSCTTMFIFHPVWVGFVFVILFAGAFGVGLSGMTRAKEKMQFHAQRTRLELSDVTDAIARLVDRETMALMDPERYAQVEEEAKPKPKAKPSRLKMPRPPSDLELQIQRKEEAYRSAEEARKRARQLDLEMKKRSAEVKVPRYWTVTEQNGTVVAHGNEHIVGLDDWRFE